MYRGNSLQKFRDKILIQSSMVKESKKKKYIKMQTNTVLRVRQFQPSHAPLITELCGESLRIFRLNAASLFVTYPLTCRVCVVISV
jgi:hypothetical protein